MKPAHRRVLEKRQRSISVGDDEADPESSSTSAAAATSNAAVSRSSVTTEDSVVEESSTTSTTRSVETETETATTSETQSISSTTSTTSSSSSSSTSSTSTSLSAQTSAIVRGSSTSYVTSLVVVSGAPSASVSPTASSASSNSSDGPGAGMVVGVVAGSLVGIVVIAGLLGYFFKTKFGKDKDDDIDDAVFNKNDFRHESILLQDDDALSMRSGSAMGSLNAAGMGRNMSGVHRSNTSDPRGGYGQAYNASPINSHFAGAPAMPSFQPGQVVNTNFYNQPSGINYAGSDGGYGIAASYGQTKSLQPGQYASLDRAPSVASHYDDGYGQDMNRQPSYTVAPSYRTHDYPPQNGRSGSPVDHNPQQFHEAETLRETGQHQPAYHQQQETTAARQLSVRNPPNNRDSDGAYDGMGF